MDRRRVVITGMGVVAPTGIGIDPFWNSLVQGFSAIRQITLFDASSYPCHFAAEVPDFDPTEYMTPKTAKRLARFAQFSLAASKLAIEDSGLNLKTVDPFRMGVVIGTAIGGGEVIERQQAIFMEKGMKRLSPFAAVMSYSHSAAGAISCEFGVKGLNTTVASGCNSGLDALYSSYNAIRLGDTDVMLAGAGEAPITPYAIALFSAAGILSTDDGDPQNAVRPFDMHGDGIVLGEGGAVLILEEVQHALKRKARIYGEVLGYGSTHEAYNLYEFDPSGEAATTVMRKALENADLRVQDIHYINAHGNGMLKHDLSETNAIKRVFGEYAYKIPVTSIKPIIGQSFSVTGILQMITCLLAINRSIIPPTINHRHPQPGCDLDYVPDHFRRASVDTALMNARGFGGSHTSIIAGKLF